jgi:type VI protein secretion system component VasK
MAQGGSVADAAPKMVEGGDVSSIETNWGTWIAIGLVSLTLVSLILQIAVHRKNLKKVDADDEALQKDVRELKMNVKKQMGEKYETLA